MSNKIPIQDLDEDMELIPKRKYKQPIKRVRKTKVDKAKVEQEVNIRKEKLIKQTRSNHE